MANSNASCSYELVELDPQLLWNLKNDVLDTEIVLQFESLYGWKPETEKRSRLKSLVENVIFHNRKSLLLSLVENKIVSWNVLADAVYLGN